jgi:hypothetical protein
MQKSTLETFIKRYSLGGICETAHWYSDAAAQTLIARAHTETKTVILKVTLKKWEGVESCQLALPSSTKIKSMLGPIGDEVTISLNKVRDRVANFTISDQDCEAVCTVAEYDAFPETLDVDLDSVNVPSDFEVEMKLTDEFVTKMMKGVSALSEAKDFVLMNNKKGGLDMIINYEDTNTNRIRIPVTTVDGKGTLDAPIGFSTPVFKAIINANDKVQDSVLKVSSRGIAIIKFDDELFKSTYFLFPTRVIE